MYSKTNSVSSNCIHTVTANYTYECWMLDHMITWIQFTTHCLLCWLPWLVTYWIKYFLCNSNNVWCCLAGPVPLPGTAELCCPSHYKAPHCLCPCGRLGICWCWISKPQCQDPQLWHAGAYGADTEPSLCLQVLLSLSCVPTHRSMATPCSPVESTDQYSGRS